MGRSHAVELPGEHRELQGPGQSPGDRDLHPPRAVARSCHHAQAVPLVTSSAAGSSVGSLRVAGLISRIHLRKMGKSDSVETGEARGTPESALQKAKRQESTGDLTGATAALSQQHSAAKTSAVPRDCPSSPKTSRQMHWGFQDSNEPPGKEPGQELVLLEKLLVPQTSLG